MTLRAGIAALLGLLVSASVAWAEAPTTSPIPQTRPRPVEVVAAPVPAIRPKPRPANLAVPVAQAPARQAAPAKGSVCGNPNIRGAALQAIKSRVKGCNVSAPVSVTEINGVKLVPSATINCTQAQALASWIDRGLQPQFDNQVVRLMVADSYSCRPRNNVRGGRISEHGAGNAIDISGVVLVSGKVLTVASNFRGALRAAHKAACGIFNTTLGPGSDGYHEDHMHLDVGRPGSRPYCR